MDLEELRTACDQERRTDSLQHLRDSFYDDAVEYVKQLKRERSRRADAAGDPYTPEALRLTDEIDTAQETIESLYERRRGKIVTMASFAAASKSVETDGMTEQERQLFDDLVDRMKSNERLVLDTSLGGTEAGEPPAPSSPVDAVTESPDSTHAAGGETDAGQASADTASPEELLVSAPEAAPGEQSAPGGQTAPSGDTTANGQAASSEQPTPSGQAVPSGDGTANGQAPPSEQTTANGQTAPSDGVTPDEQVTPGGQAASSEQVSGDASEAAGSRPATPAGGQSNPNTATEGAPSEQSGDPLTDVMDTTSASAGTHTAETERDRPSAEATAVVGEATASPNTSGTESVSEDAERSADDQPASDASVTTADDSGETTADPEDERGVIEREPVRVTADVGAVLGVDSTEYELSAGDTVSLPAANVEPLAEQGAVERL